MKEKRLKQWMQSGAWRDRDARCCSPVALIFIYCTHSNGPVCLARQMAHYIFKIYWNDCGARFVLMEWFRETERSRSSLFHFLIDTYFNWINSRYPIPCGVLIYWLHICNLQTHCQCHQENWPPSFRFCFFFFSVPFELALDNFIRRFEWSTYGNIVGICFLSSGRALCAQLAPRPKQFQISEHPFHAIFNFISYLSIAFRALGPCEQNKKINEFHSIAKCMKCSPRSLQFTQCHFYCTKSMHKVGYTVGTGANGAVCGTDTKMSG